MNDKIAIFVAGDERIFFPALVALDSIQKHNPGVFAPYMSFDADKLTEEMIAALQYHDIKFIDAKKLGVTERLLELPIMREGRWPIEIMFNWALPEFLAKMGYDYSIKVDYDVLCIDKYEISHVLPEQSIARGLVFDVDLVKEGVSAETIAKSIDAGLYKPNVKAYVNAGFVAFDNKKCVNDQFFDKLIRVYSLIAQNSPEAKLLEQLAVFFALSVCEGGVEEIDGSYNHRVRYGILVDDNLKPTAKNIHYITSLKPWKPFDRKSVRSFVNGRQGVLFSYRAIWLERASSSPWFSMFCDEIPMTQEQVLGLNIIIAHNYNQRVYELESEVRSLKEKITAS